MTAVVTSSVAIALLVRLHLQYVELYIFFYMFST